MSSTLARCNCTEPLLDVRGLCVRFIRGTHIVRAVDGLSYRLHAGRTLAIVGESGSGKTASCRALVGLLPQSATVTGSVRLGGKELMGLPEHQMRRHRGADVSMIFQDPARALNPTMRVGHQIAETIRQHTRLEGAEAASRAVALLDMLGVPAAGQRFHSYAHELSGGMRQRVIIAMALAANPRVLIADEATRSLDAITQGQTLALLKGLQQRLGTALIMVTHDLRLALSFADEVLVMYAGRAVERASSERLAELPRMRYTRALFEAIPRIDRPPHTRFPVVPGQPPDLAALPAGCAFEPRCAHARDLCRSASPTLDEGDSEHTWACWHPAEYPQDA